jgi:CubicO group peptidase (beta-lactamase class C family)
MKDKVWYGGGMAHYSDLSMIVLGLIVERITGMPLDVFASKEIFEPLGMRHTSFRPVDTTDFNPMIVPTEVDQMHRNRLLWGEGLDLLQSFQIYFVHSMNCSMPSLWIVVELQN